MDLKVRFDSCKCHECTNYNQFLIVHSWLNNTLIVSNNYTNKK